MAQTNGNAPTDLSPQKFRSIAGQYGEWAKTCRFAVRILYSNPNNPLLQGYSTFMQDITYLCESTELPSRGLVNAPVRYYGPEFKMPFQTSYEDTVLTLLCRTESYERQFFDDWMNYIHPTNSWDMKYRDTYKAEVQMFQLAEYDDGNGNPKPVYQWTLHNAWPLLVNSQPVSWADDNVQRLAVAFTYTHWTSGTGSFTEPKSSGSFGGLVDQRPDTYDNR